MYNKDTHKISKLSLYYFVLKLIFYNVTHFFSKWPLHSSNAYFFILKIFE